LRDVKIVRKSKNVYIVVGNMGLYKKVREMLRERESAISIDVVEGVCLIRCMCMCVCVFLNVYECMYVCVYVCMFVCVSICE